MRSGDDNDFVIFAKNGGISSNIQLTKLLSELSSITWDIVLFSETRTRSGKQILDGGHILYTHLQDNHCAGVGILLHAKHVKSSQVVHAISDRILALDFVVNHIRIRAVAVYMPHCGYSADHFEQTADQLRCVLDEATQQRRRIIVGGDFNSQLRVGHRSAYLDNLASSFGLHITNDTVDSWDNQWTFCSSLDVKRRIDFIFVSRSFQT